jgi:hypothetical protein
MAPFNDQFHSSRSASPRGERRSGSSVTVVTVEKNQHLGRVGVCHTGDTPLTLSPTRFGNNSLNQAYRGLRRAVGGAVVNHYLLNDLREDQPEPTNRQQSHCCGNDHRLCLRLPTTRAKMVACATRMHPRPKCGPPRPQPATARPSLEPIAPISTLYPTPTPIGS